LSQELLLRLAHGLEHDKHFSELCRFYTMFELTPELRKDVLQRMKPYVYRNAEELFAEHAFSRERSRSDLEESLRSIDEDIEQFYGRISPHEAIRYGGTSEAIRARRLFHAEYEFFCFFLTYYYDAQFLRERCFRWFKAVVVLKLFFQKATKKFLLWCYHPGNPGYLRGKTAFEKQVLSQLSK
jgi:hypothetical protein